MKIKKIRERICLNKQSHKDYEILKEILISLRETGFKLGLSEEQMLSNIFSRVKHQCYKETNFLSRYFVSINFSLIVMILMTIVAVMLNGREISLNRCIIENNYFLMEISRPVTDCKICKDVENFTVLENVTQEEFSQYAYLGHPLLVKGGCLNWTALRIFNFEFFKNLYASSPGAFESVEDECQFFPFRTTFLSLQEVLFMPESRAKMTFSDEEPWYIGWSNCNPDISSILRQHYSKPYFLPSDSELSAIDWIFMGYKGPGASMHLDYVRRPSWQAQIKGKKSWYLLPPPECENVCTSMNITVEQGDIILIDTNQWYHTTFVEGEEMSITLGSEDQSNYRLLDVSKDNKLALCWVPGHRGNMEMIADTLAQTHKFPC